MSQCLRDRTLECGGDFDTCDGCEVLEPINGVSISAHTTYDNDVRIEVGEGIALILTHGSKTDALKTLKEFRDKRSIYDILSRNPRVVRYADYPDVEVKWEPK